jgi:intergrase/recombinase
MQKETRNELFFDWEDFREWLRNGHSKGTISYIMRYAKRHFRVFENPVLASEIRVFNKDKRRHVMQALANLSKYLGIYENWKAIARNNDLHWENRSSLETVLSILNSDIEGVEVWLFEAVRRLPKKHATVLVFAALTGLRPTETCDSCRLISVLAEKGRLDEYLDKELMMLQHLKYGKLFLRETKNAFISFVSKELLELVVTQKPKLTYWGLKRAMQRRKLPIKTKELRKLFGTKLREYLPTEFVDLLQGRISKSVFGRFYYKPILRSCREKTLKAIQPLQTELLSIIHNKKAESLSA